MNTPLSALERCTCSHEEVMLCPVHGRQGSQTSNGQVAFLKAKLCEALCTCRNAQMPNVQHAVHCQYYVALYTMPPDETTARRPEPDDDPASMAGSWRYENAGNPTDGQLMDQLETAFEKMNDGYVCMDMALRKRLAITLNEFMRPAVKSVADSGAAWSQSHTDLGAQK